ncbi:MAG: methyltransferase domain-containing protein [Acidobacteriota bacterium]|nr:methyltransferase domain-containing protein [Acidobacteriota bacterium]
MGTPTPDFAAIKKAMKAAWMAGDFGKIAELNTQRGEEFVERLNLKPGMRVLDVACGTGNQALPAARTGAEVTGLDHAPNLLQQAREAAAHAGLKIRFIEGDAEELPFEASEFDVVYSMFGAMFAPRPERVASEFLRVCKRGGLIAMASWTPTSFQAETFKLNAKYAPPPPGLPAPVLWGDENVVRERFGSRAKVETWKREVVFDFPFGPSKVIEIFRTYFGPTQMTLARLDPAAQAAMLAEMTEHWASRNEGDANHTIVRGEYLEVHARPV